VRERLADLHIHTKYSDGSFSPEEVVRGASEREICCIAITDHDSVSGIDEAIKAGKECDIEVIPGVEVSAEEADKEMHILGYCMDYKDPLFLEFLSKIRQDRIERLHKMVSALNSHGFSIDPEDVLKFTGDVSISRLHIARYMESKGLISNWRVAFKKYIGDTKPCYVSSFRYTSQMVMDAIKNVKGVPVIAHPVVNRLDPILPRLIEEGLQGIEVFHTKQPGSIAERYKKFAIDNDLIITGGSDCHGDAKGAVLIGKTSIPYSYVEALKNGYKNS